MRLCTVQTLSYGMILLGWMSGLVLAQSSDAKPLDAVPAKADDSSRPSTTLAAAAPVAAPSELAQLAANSVSPKSRTLGLLYDQCKRSDDPMLYKYQVELTNAGAGIASVILSEFDNRDHDNPVPLKLLGPIVDGKKTIVPLACQNLKLAFESEDFGPNFPLDRLNWTIVGDPAPDEVRFEAVIGKRLPGEVPKMGTELLRLTKIYRIQPGSYDLDCQITAENLADRPIKIQFEIVGPSGIEREAIRMEDRKIIGGFLDKKENVTWARKEMVAGFWGKTFLRQVGLRDSTESYHRAMLSGDQTAKNNARYDVLIGRNLSGSAKPAKFLWAGLANKYFVAILRPIPAKGERACEWIGDQTAWFHNPDGDARVASGDENISTILSTQPILLAPAGTAGAVRKLDFQLYLGPKDRELFGKTPLYKQLGYFYTIDFMSCCCPAWIIRPLAFGILWMMKAMYSIMGPLGNYGIVIMILVFVVRLLLHPITKKSQVSMSGLQKLGPKMEQLRAQYGNEPMEMQKKMRELYRESGVNPAMGVVPILVQMPIWIALWSAVDSSVDLRGAGFLPFWITDLSAPDAIFRFRELSIPLLGKIDSINLLPLLMGFVMYLQQKMMPSPGAATNPQMAQQQKIMLIMMPILFPLMLYTGPSGVNLYIMSSMAAGVIEQKIIKKHIERRDAEKSLGLVPVTSKTGGKVKKPKAKPLFKINR
ncbi:MAG: membrane protein insertase YidC [Phycisphaerae bacterium]|nr:membrane protein insertase YidC [Phycisphaerae bacterium]